MENLEKFDTIELQEPEISENTNFFNNDVNDFQIISKKISRGIDRDKII
jgi:hypothetical protein